MLKSSHTQLSFFDSEGNEIYRQENIYPSKFSIYFDKENIKLIWIIKGTTLNIQSIKLAGMLKIKYLDDDWALCKDYEFEILDTSGSTDSDSESQELVAYVLQFILK